MSLFNIVNKEPNFVFESTVNITLDNGNVVEFDEDEEVTIRQDKNGDIVLGDLVEGERILVDEANLALQLLEAVIYKKDIRAVDNDVPVSEAILAPDISPKDVAAKLIELGLNNVKEAANLTIPIRRKVMEHRNPTQKSKFIYQYKEGKAPSNKQSTMYKMTSMKTRRRMPSVTMGSRM